MELSVTQRDAVRAFLTDFTEYIGQNNRAAAVTFDELERMLTPAQKTVVDTLLEIDPHHFGFSGPRYSSPTPDDLIVVTNQVYTVDGAPAEIPPRLVPIDVYATFRTLNTALRDEIGSRLLIQSGYRSPAYQCFVFLFQLRERNWNFRETARYVALPYYSEHGTPKRQALDFTVTEIESSDTYDFAETAEYRWLCDHAGDFGFSLSFPEGNKYNIAFEPWHWRYTAQPITD